MVVLRIDYSNGSEKFLLVPLGGDKSLTAVLDAAESIRPGVSYVKEASGHDRGGREVGWITEVDGLDAAGETRWRIWRNGSEVTDLRWVVSGSMTRAGEPRLTAGDSVLLKLVAS